MKQLSREVLRVPAAGGDGPAWLLRVVAGLEAARWEKFPVPPAKFSPAKSWLPDKAVMVTVPGADPLAMPAEFTLAMFASEELH